MDIDYTSIKMLRKYVGLSKLIFFFFWLGLSLTPLYLRIWPVMFTHPFIHHGVRLANGPYRAGSGAGDRQALNTANKMTGKA